MLKDTQTRIVINIIAAVITIGLLCVALSSCNPVKRVLNDSAKMQKVFDKGVELGWCVNDSVYVSDTTVLLDTLYNIEYKSDTVTVGDSVWIDRVEYREKTINKQTIIRDTAIVRDNSLIDLQRKLIDTKQQEIQALYTKGKELESDLKGMKQQRNKWRLYFFLLLAAVIGWTLRKPIIKLISPIKL